MGTISGGQVRGRSSSGVGEFGDYTLAAESCTERRPYSASQNKPDRRGSISADRYDKLSAVEVGASNCGEPTISLQVVVLLLLVSLLLIVAPSLVRCQQQQLYYYASLPKVGYIRGLRLESAGQLPVAAFLGIPYAAPATGLLRFMPPGAASSANQRPAEQGQLMPGAHQRVPVRPHTHLGRQCVHLPDWLEPEPPQGSQETSGSREPNKSDAAADSSENLATVRSRQSEDCLNLNAFVPINEFSANNNQRKSIGQQIKPNYPSNYQQPQAYSHSVDSAGQQSNQYHPGASIQLANGSADYQPASSSDLLNQATDSNNKQSPVPVPVPVWPLPKGDEAASPRLPVLVVVHGSGPSRAKQNPFSFLNLARKTNSLVITFNYRLGLLGFLPYSINEGPSLPSASLLARNNHAIWDQIGLLHWLNRNAIHFNGDPKNITLVAADNKANQFVQLLTMSPPAKGLFKRAVLAHCDESSDRKSPLPTMSDHGLGGPPTLAKLISLATKARDLRRQLNAALNRVVQQMAPDMAMDERKTLEFIQFANLSKLAKIERKLGHLNSGNDLLSLVYGPALDDRLLFPQLVSLAAHRTSAIGANLGMLNSRLNYCHYLRQLYAGHSDPLNLLSYPKFNAPTNLSGLQQQPDLVEVGSGSFVGIWHRDVNVSHEATKTTMDGVVGNFWHLKNLNLLTKWLELGRGAATGRGNEEDDELGEDEEEVDDFSESSRRQQSRTVLAAHGSALVRRHETGSGADHKSDAGIPRTAPPSVKRSAPSTDPNEDFGQLLELMASYDLLLGYFTMSSGSSFLFQSAPGGVSDELPKDKMSKFPHVVDELFRLLPASRHQRQLIELLELSDLHYVSVLSRADTNAQYCDLFLPTPKSIESSHIFIVFENKFDEKQQESSWLIDSMERNSSAILDGLSNFIRFGNPNDGLPKQPEKINASLNWPNYDTSNRELKLFTDTGDSIHPYSVDSYPSGHQYASNRFREQLELHLDLLPFLNVLERNSTPMFGYDSNLSSDRSLLFNCLGEIDALIGAASPAAKIAPYQSRSQVFHCLTDSIYRFKTLVRQYAADDLEPINSKLRTAARPTLSSSGTRANFSSRSSNIALRNLVSGSDSGIDLQQLDQPAANSIEDPGQPLQSLPKKQTQSSASVSAPPPLPKQVSSVSSSRGSIFGTFFEKIYKDAAGQALALVVGCGLVIFLANLAIVVIITLRASRVRRRLGERGDSQPGCGRLSPGNFGRMQELGDQQVAAGNQKKVPGMRSSLKMRNNQGNAGAGLGVGQSNCTSEGSCSLARATKQLKFDLSGIESPAGESKNRNDCPDGIDLLEAQQEIGARLGEIEAEPEACSTFQHQPVMFLSATNPCNGLLARKNLDTDYYDGNRNCLLANSDVRSHQNLDIEELQVENLVHGWHDETEQIYSKRHQDNQYNSHQFHHHQPAHYQHHGGSLNSPHTQSTTASTTNGTSHYNRDDTSQQQYQQQQLVSAPEQRRFLTQISPDSSATISITPIQLESFTGPLPAPSPIGHQQQLEEFHLIEPTGLFYQTGFTSSADNIGGQHKGRLAHHDSNQNNKIFMLTEQRQHADTGELHNCQQPTNKQVPFCSHHQRL